MIVRRSNRDAWGVTRACALCVGVLVGACTGEEETNCPAGAYGCPCGQQGACAPGLVCQPSQDGLVCAPAGGTTGTTGSGSDGCVPGNEGCACANGFACADGLTCEMDTCVPEGGTGGGCTPGTLGCACDGGSCDAGLVCEGGTCTKEPTGTTGGEMCVTHDDCGADEMCFEGACESIDWLNFVARVEWFDPPSCVDGVGSKELYYRAYLDDELAFTSSEDGCPAS